MSREIFRCAHGSCLFGTSTPQSDEDFRSVVLPSRDQVLLGRADYVVQSESRDRPNVAGDVDRTEFSAQAFLKLLGKSEVGAIEMLFAPPLVSSPEWSLIEHHRDRLVCSNVAKFAGFSRSQLLRYGWRGENVRVAREVIAALPASGRRPVCEDEEAMSALSSIASSGRKVRIWRDPKHPTVPILTIGDRSAQLTQPPSAVRAVFEAIIEWAGERSLRAAENPSGADAKGLYHALRILLEAEELLRTGALRFPLESAPVLLRVRSGELSTQECIALCERADEAVAQARAITELPDTTDALLIEDLTKELHEMALGAHEPERTPS